MKVLMISRPTLFTVPGGDTVQILETARALRKIEVKVDVKLADEKIDYSTYDLIHFFNIIRPNNIIPHIKKSKLPYVVSTIFVDYTEVEKKYRGKLAKLLFRLFGADGMEYLKTIARGIVNNESMVDYGYVFRGHKKSIEKVLNYASILLPNSESEYRRLKQRYSFSSAHNSIPNGVDKSYYNSKVSTDRSGVICVARIEPIKNQLNLIRALKGKGIPLKIIGSPSPNWSQYFDACKSEADENVTFLGHLSKEGVKQEYQKAKVHILPSWFETTGLSSLEAAVSGCNVIITAKGDTLEYFGDKVLYCDPGDCSSILGTINEALSSEPEKTLKEKISQKYTWEQAAAKTAEAYNKVKL